MHILTVNLIVPVPTTPKNVNKSQIMEKISIVT